MQRDAAAWSHCDSTLHQRASSPSSSSSSSSSTPLLSFDQFLERGLDKVSFQEYSTSSPHIQWSVGFAGRPGGPDFYINKIDNSVLHGPGGSTAEHDLHNEADPCFGKVVEGTEVVNEIDRIPVDADKGYVMLHPVKVVSAKITTERKVEEDAIPLPEVKWDQEQGRWV